MAADNTETLVYLIDLQIPGIEEKTAQVTALRGQLDGLPKIQREVASESANVGRGARAAGEGLQMGARGATALGESVRSAREMLRGLGEESGRIAGVNMPAVERSVLAASTVIRQMAGAVEGGALTMAAVGFLGVAAAVGTAATALTFMGDEYLETIEEIQFGGKVAADTAEAIAHSLQGVAERWRQDSTEMNLALGSVAGRLTQYTGEVLEAGNATAFMDRSAQLALATNTKLGQATNSLTNIMIAYRIPVEEAGRVNDVLYNTARLTGMSLEGMETIAGRLAARLGDAKPEIEDIGFVLDVASAAGLRGQRALMPVISLMQELVNPTGEAKDVLEKLGIELEHQEGRARPLRELLPELGQKFGDLTKEDQRYVAQLLVGAEHTGTFISMMEQARDHGKEMAEAIEESGTAQERAQAQTDGLGERLGVLGSQAKTAAQNLGGELAKGAMWAADRFNDLGTAIHNANAALDEWANRRARTATAEVAFAKQFPNFEPSGPEDIRAEMGARIAASRQAAADAAEEAAAAAAAITESQAPAQRQAGSLLGEMTAQGFRDNVGRGLAAYRAELGSATGPLAQAFHAGIAALQSASETERPAVAKSLQTSLASALDQVKLTMINEKIPGWREIGQRGEALIAAALANPSASTIGAVDAWFREVGAILPDKEKELAKSALDGFRAGIASQEARMKAELGDVGAQLMTAATEAFANPKQEGAGKALASQVETLTNKLRELEYGDWQTVHDNLARTLERALVEQTPATQAAAREMIRSVTFEVQSAEFWHEWKKAATDAAKERNAAMLDAAERISEAQAEERRALEETAQEYRDRSAIDAAREAVTDLVDTKRQALAEDETNERRHLQTVKDSLQQEREARREAAQQAREAFDVNTRRAREERDVRIQHDRAVEDLQREHNKRLADITKAGGPDVAKNIAAEQMSYREQLANLTRQERRALEDRKRRRADEDADRQEQLARRQADRQLELAERARDRADQIAAEDASAARARQHAKDLKDYQRQLEILYAIDKDTLQAREQQKAEQRIRETTQRATDAANRHVQEVFDRTDQKLSDLFDNLARRYPWIRSLEEFSQYTREGPAPLSLLDLNMFRDLTSGGGALRLGAVRPRGFATGGAFTVGGQGGPDSQLVQFMATPGERVTITPGGSVRLGGPNQDLYTTLAAQQQARAQAQSALAQMAAATPRAAAGARGAAGAAPGPVYYLQFSFTISNLVGEGGMRQLAREVFEEAQRELRGTVLLAGGGPS